MVAHLRRRLGREPAPEVASEREREGEQQQQHKPITSAVCVALGSLVLAWPGRVRSVWQLVLFVDLVQIGEFRSFLPSLCG